MVFVLNYICNNIFKDSSFGDKRHFLPSEQNVGFPIKLWKTEMVSLSSRPRIIGNVCSWSKRKGSMIYITKDSDSLSQGSSPITEPHLGCRGHPSLFALPCGHSGLKIQGENADTLLWIVLWVLKGPLFILHKYHVFYDHP